MVFFRRLHWAIVLNDVYGWTFQWTFILSPIFVCIFAVPVDENSEKVILSVENVLLSRHKDVAPEDSDDPQDIGLSSEEEAEDLPELPHVRRKYHQAPGPPPPPVPEPTPLETTASTSTDTATIQVPVAALEQVHAILGQIISGQSPIFLLLVL